MTVFGLHQQLNGKESEIISDYLAARNKDFFGLLGVGEHFSNAEVRKAYLRAVKQYHPDYLKHQIRQEVSPFCQYLFSKLCRAEETLMNGEMLKEYAAAQRPRLATQENYREATLYAEANFLLGFDALEKGEILESVKLFGQSHSLRPAEPHYGLLDRFTKMCLNWAEKKQYWGEFKRLLDATIKKHPRFAFARLLLGFVYLEDGQTNAAVKEFQKFSSGAAPHPVAMSALKHILAESPERKSCPGLMEEFFANPMLRMRDAKSSGKSG